MFDARKRIAWFGCVLMSFATSVIAGEFDLTVLDESGATLPCRILVRAAGKSVLPEDTTTLTTGLDTWFMSQGDLASKLKMAKSCCALKADTNTFAFTKRFRSLGGRNTRSRSNDGSTYRSAASLPARTICMLIR